MKCIIVSTASNLSNGNWLWLLPNLYFLDYQSIVYRYIRYIYFKCIFNNQILYWKFAVWNLIRTISFNAKKLLKMMISISPLEVNQYLLLNQVAIQNKRLKNVRTCRLFKAFKYYQKTYPLYVKEFIIHKRLAEV